MLTGGPRFQAEGLPATRHRLALGFAIIAVGMTLGRSQVALLLCAFLLAGAAAEIMRAPQPSHLSAPAIGRADHEAILSRIFRTGRLRH